MNHSLPSCRLGLKTAACLGLVTVAAAAAVTRTAVAAQPLTARFVVPHAVSAVVFRPRQILERLPDGGEAVSLWAIEASRWSLLPPHPLRTVIRVVETCGFLLRDVEEVGSVVPFLEEPLPGFQILVIRFRRPIDPAFVADLFRRPQVGDARGVKTIRDNDDMLAAAMVDERSLLICPAGMIDGLIAGGMKRGPVHDAIGRVGTEADVAGAFTPAGLPADVVPADSAVAGLRVGEFAMRFGARPVIEGTITVADPDATARAAAEFEPLLRRGTAALTTLVATIGSRRPGPPASGLTGLRSLAEAAQRWAAALEVSRENERLVFAATAPADAGFPADIGPLLLLPDPVADADLDEEADTADDDSVPSHWRPFDFDAARRSRVALHATADALHLRNRFPVAIGFDAESFMQLANADAAPARDLPDQPVSLLALTGNFFDTTGVSPARDRTFVVHSSRPNDIARPFVDTLLFNSSSLVRVEDVTGVACSVDGDAATGTVTFASDIARGELPFHAVRDGATWRFTALELPGWRMTCTLRPNGAWRLRGDLGPYGEEPPGQDVTLAPTLESAPAGDVRLLLYREPQLDVFEVHSDLTARLPPGRYLVQALGTDLDESLRGDGPSITVPPDRPNVPLAFELDVLRKAGSGGGPATER